MSTAHRAVIGTEKDLPAYGTSMAEEEWAAMRVSAAKFFGCCGTG